MQCNSLISLVLMADIFPRELETGRNYPVTPQIKGTVKSLPGVVAVEDV